MKTLVYNNERFDAEKIIKSENSIKGLNSDNVTLFKFNGITDFTPFKVFNQDNTEGVFDTPDPSILELQKTIFDLTSQLVKGGII